MSENEIDIKPLFAEIVGTFGLVYIAGLVALQADAGELGLLGVSIANMLVLTFMVYFAGPISGAHFNPAVTIGFIVTQRMEALQGLLYIVSQLIASIIAGILLLFTAGDLLLDAAADKSVLGFPQLDNNYSLIEGFAIEIILTFFLVFVYWVVTVDDRAPSSVYGFAIGGAVGFGILAGGPITGAAMNPARVLGPMIVAFQFDGIFLYILGPIIGAIIAAFLYYYVFLEADKVEG